MRPNQERRFDAVGGSRRMPIIDVFAGSVGLGECFSAFADARGESRFRLALSPEKHEAVCRTLRLLAIRRRVAAIGELDSYFCLLHGEIQREALTLFHQSKRRRARRSGALSLRCNLCTGVRPLSEAGPVSVASAGGSVQALRKPASDQACGGTSAAKESEPWRTLRR